MTRLDLGIILQRGQLVDLMKCLVLHFECWPVSSFIDLFVCSKRGHLEVPGKYFLSFFSFFLSSFFFFLEDSKMTSLSGLSFYKIKGGWGGVGV